jgi:hypothetical protein
MSSALLLAALQTLDAWVIERSARATVTDLLGEAREIHAVERLTVAEGRLRIEDLTFGGVTVVRADTGRIWTADRFLKLVYETGLKEAAEARGRELEALGRARQSVRGTLEEARLTALRAAFGAHDAEPSVETVEDGGARAVVADGVFRAARVELDPARGGAYYGLLADAGAVHPAVGRALRELKGLPVKGEERYVLFDRSRHVVFEVTAARREAVAAALFDPPAGYAAAAGPQLRGPRR